MHNSKLVLQRDLPNQNDPKLNLTHIVQVHVGRYCSVAFTFYSVLLPALLVSLSTVWTD